MPDQSENSSARVLAPAALAVCAIAFFGVILASSGGEDDREDERRENTSRAKRPASKRAPAGNPNAATYTVKTGDTQAGIASKTNVPVERIQELNPELDPQTLIVGQRIRLRE